MNILIVGLGEVGSHLAKVLSSEGHSVTVIDSNLRNLERETEGLDVRHIKGDGSWPSVLDQADADVVDLLLAVSSDDRVNMLTCLFGKRMGAKSVVLRVKDTTPFEGFRTFFRKNLMFDLLLSLEDLAAFEITKTIRENQAVEVENFVDGKVQMRRLRLKEDSSLLSAPVKDIKIPDGVLITAIDRDHEIVIPGGEDVLQADDEIIVVGEPHSIEAFEKLLGTQARTLRKVVISGGTGIAEQVCRALEGLRVDTRIIVEDRERAEDLSAKLAHTLVIHGQGEDLDLLREEHVGDADAFLAITDDDENNLMSCQLARSLGVARTVALVHRPDYVSIYETLGIDVAISPRLLCASRILSFVRSGSVSTIATIEDGKAEVLELEVRPGSKIVGKTLAQIRFPRGCVVGAIARETGEVVIPQGTTVIEALDNLVLFILTEVVDKVVKLVRKS